MKEQMFSDLHLGVLPIEAISIADGIDAVIVAGDVCEGAVPAGRQVMGSPSFFSRLNQE
ncbi:metallophosphoesterase [Bradyrhizobium diazoefficiens]|nr:metallophosphoesterase [Bradyrhizobium diazoefficiens]QQO22622.1 metallophosphoesterase [Bradyrhizobium diazoefficiens]